MACASGMAALMNTFLNILSSGDELISSASLYGGTIDLFHDLELASQPDMSRTTTGSR